MLAAQTFLNCLSTFQLVFSIELSISRWILISNKSLFNRKFHSCSMSRRCKWAPSSLHLSPCLVSLTPFRHLFIGKDISLSPGTTATQLKHLTQATRQSVRTKACLVDSFKAPSTGEGSWAPASGVSVTMAWARQAGIGRLGACLIS